MEASLGTGPRVIDRGSVTGRAVVDRQTIHVHDIAAESDAEFPESQGRKSREIAALERDSPRRCCAKVSPSERLRFAGREVRPFTDTQIKLLEYLRRPSRHRHRECAAVPGTAGATASYRVAGAANRDERDPGCHRQLADGHSTGAGLWLQKTPRGCVRPTIAVIGSRPNEGTLASNRGAIRGQCLLRRYSQPIRRELACGPSGPRSANDPRPRHIDCRRSGTESLIARIAQTTYWHANRALSNAAATAEGVRHWSHSA